MEKYHNRHPPPLPGLLITVFGSRVTPQSRSPPAPQRTGEPRHRLSSSPAGCWAGASRCAQLGSVRIPALSKHAGATAGRRTTTLLQLLGLKLLDASISDRKTVWDLEQQRNLAASSLWPATFTHDGTAGVGDRRPQSMAVRSSTCDGLLLILSTP